MAGASDHPRLILPRFVPLDLCKELEFIHQSCGTVGYRPGVFSTTLSHLVATNCAHLILPFVSIRERLKEKVEEFFGCEYELVIEFTGLVSWSKGASIGWHSDDNRPYLKQRDFTAVCYLNNYGHDFKGGVFHFKDGEPASILPVAGDAVIYTADNQNIHSVDEVLEGERLTLTLWFSRDSSHDEDAKLIAAIHEKYYEECRSHYFHLPSPASSNMYWYSQHQSGFDIRWARIHALGYNFFSSDNQICNSTSGSSNDPLEQPVRLSRGDKIYNKEFENSMHALQVVQFHQWKSSELRKERRNIDFDRSAKLVLLEMTGNGESMMQGDLQHAEAVFGHNSLNDGDAVFDWAKFMIAEEEWEAYTQRLHQVLLTSILSWRSHQIIFSVNSSQETSSS